MHFIWEFKLGGSNVVASTNLYVFYAKKIIWGVTTFIRDEQKGEIRSELKPKKFKDLL